MSYWKTMYGQRNKDFIEGVKAGLKAYAWWKNGIEYIGQQQADGKGTYRLKNVIKEAEEELSRVAPPPRRERMKQIGNRLYEICPGCGKMICLNKFIFGDLHLCSTDEELQNPQYRQQLNKVYEQMKQQFERDFPTPPK